MKHSFLIKSLLPKTVVFVFLVASGVFFGNAPQYANAGYYWITWPEEDSDENFGETFAPCRSQSNCNFGCGPSTVGRSCWDLTCTGSGNGGAAYFYTHTHTCAYEPDVCVADPSCAASTCSTDTCRDVCNNVYTGTRDCTVPCTVSNACGDTASGIIVGGSCSATPPAAVDQCPADPGLQCSPAECSAGPVCVWYAGLGCSASNSCSMTGYGSYDCDGNCSAVAPSDALCGPVCVWYQGMACSASNSCGMTNPGTYDCLGSCSAVPPSEALCPSDSLKICENSCSSGLKRDGASFSMATGSTRNLVACWNTASDCSDSSGNVTTSASWGEGGGSTISLSGSNPKVVTANSAGSESISVTYSGNNRSTTASVSCVPSVTCATAPEGTNHCPSDTYTVNDGCGATLTCNGRRACDFNWKEVAP